MRVFIAIDLPENIKSKIFHKIENLQEKNLLKGKFVEKENLHLTLKFFGEVTSEQAEKIKQKLNEIKFEKFNCTVGKTGVFDNSQYVKIIWLELISDKFEDLQKEIINVFPEFPADSKKFNSHITLVRVKSVFNKENLFKELKKINLKKEIFEIKEFVLMKSELTRQGAKYKIIERYNLC